MRNSRKNSIIRGLTVILAVLLMATFMLAGCADKEAQAAADAANQAAKDAATKAEDAQKDADKNADDIAKLPTEDSVKKAIADAVAAYIAGTSGVAGSDLVTADEISDFLTSDGVVELLADYVTAEDADEIVAKFADYLTASAIETDYVKKTLIGDLGDAATIAAAIQAVETELATALTNSINGIKDILGDREDIDADLDALEKLAGTDLPKLMDEKVDAYVSEFAATSEYVVAKVIELDNRAAAVNAKMYPTTKAYADLMAAVKKANLDLMRAQTLKGAEAIYAEIDNLLKTTPTIADTLAKLLDDYTNSNDALIMVGTTGANNLKACKDLVALAAENGVTATLTAYGTRNLVNETAAYEAFYNALVTAQTGSVAINTLIDAIANDFATTIVIQTAKYAALDTAVDNVKTAIDPWIAALNAAATTAEAAKVENAKASAAANRALFIPEEVSVYDAATQRVAKLDSDKAAADALVKKITAFDTTTAYTTNSYVLYTYADASVALVDEVEAWAVTAELPKNYTVDQVAICVTNYQTALNIEAYATLMDAKYDAAVASGLVEEAKTVAAAIIDGVALTDRTAIETAYANIKAWMVIADSTVATVVDDANVKAMLGTTKNQTKTNYELIVNAFAQMKDLVADYLEAKIDALAAKTLNVYSMANDIRPLRNEIVEWLNTYGIVATNDATQVAMWIYNANTGKNDVVYKASAATDTASYALIENIAAFESVIDAYDTLAYTILSDANTMFVDDIEAVVARDDAFILYEYEVIKTAAANYQTWKFDHQLGTIAITDIDFGETYKNIAKDVIDTYVNMTYLEIELDKTLAQAQADYADIKDLISYAINAKVTVKEYKIPAAVKAAEAWMAKYIDNRGFNAIIAALDGILTEAEVTALEAKLADYNTLVAAAVADGNDVKDMFEDVLYDGNDIKDVLDAYNAWATKYGVVYDDYAGTALDARLTKNGTDSIDMKAVIDAINDRKAAYEDLKKDVDDAIDALEALLADEKTTVEQYEAAIKAAEDAIAAYLTANEGAFDTAADPAFDVEDAKVIYTAKFKVELLATIAKVNENVSDEAKKAEIINALNHAYTTSSVSLDKVTQALYEDQVNDEFGNALSAFMEELDGIYTDMTK